MAAFDKVARLEGGSTSNEDVFSLIANDLVEQGYSVRHGALPESIASALCAYQQNLGAHKYVEAGIGRGKDFLKNEFVRTDEICWITGESDAGRHWLDWAAKLQHYLNKTLFLGLFSFESHFAHYPPGAYYKRHTDAFKGETNRVLSVVAYLNPAWAIDYGGELVLYRSDDDREGLKITPLYSTVVVFLSEDFPHEVLPANRDRYSIAGWFRVNTSINNIVDPPR